MTREKVQSLEQTYYIRIRYFEEDKFTFATENRKVGR